ncbi:MAG: class I SAM-dependent methyltransferase [Finegoldia sp.]|nr:class I SAM-dependent methyltransferase [Finegoldia sp.]
MKIKRLDKIISLVDKNSIVADIGTDHGVVPIKLIEENIAKKVIASDISPNSLQKLKNKLVFHSQDRIDTYVSDGLSHLYPYQVDTIIIAGMGGNLIKGILEKELDIARSAEKLILAANNGLYDLRKFLLDNSFYISREIDLFENEKYYQIIEAKVGKDSFDYDYEFQYGKYNIDNKSDNLKEYLLSKAREIDSIIESLKEEKPKNWEINIRPLIEKFDEIKEVIGKIEA